MLYNHCKIHPKRIDTPIQHEVRGERAQFTVQHTYKGVYPDGCKAPEHHRYALTVDKEYIGTADFHPEYKVNRRFEILHDIAITMNVINDMSYHD